MKTFDWVREFATTPEPAPVGEGAPVTPELLLYLATMPGPRGIRSEVPALIAALQARENMGAEKYGTVLRTGNGRRATVDKYQELLDALKYQYQEIMEDGVTDISRRLVNVIITALCLTQQQLRGESNGSD